MTTNLIFGSSFGKGCRKRSSRHRTPDWHRIVGNVAELEADSPPNEIECLGDVVVGRKRTHESIQVGGEVGIGELGLEMADQLGVAVDAILHAVSERRGDVAAVDLGQVETDPEVEEVSAMSVSISTRIVAVAHAGQSAR